MRILIEIGAGELFDRISILEIKLQRIAAPEKLVNVRKEHAALTAARDAHLPSLAKVQGFVRALADTNLRIWELEDEARASEASGRFGDAYIEQTRNIHRFNDQRAALKRRIDDALGSNIVEEKSYT
jgi:hypothetical protein